MLGSEMASNILRMLTGTTSQYNKGADVFMGLFTSAPVMTVNASNIVTNIDFSTYEPAIGTSGYQRERIGNYSITFTSLFGSTVYYSSASKYYYISNVAQIKFNKATGTWTANGTSNITHYGLFNASTGGTILAWGELTSTIQVAADQAANIDIGQAELRVYAEVSAQ